MADVTIRDLRNKGGEVVERVARGERLTVTKDGRPIAQLTPVTSARVSATSLLERWQRVPTVDPERFRADIDALLDTSL